MLRITGTMMFIITLSKTLDIFYVGERHKWSERSARLLIPSKMFFGRGRVVSRALIARPGIENAENARRYIALDIIYAKIFYKFWFINRLMYRVARTRVAHFIHTGMHYWRFMYVYPSPPPSFSPSPRALWSTGEPGLMEKCRVHNSIIGCTYVGVYTSVVFTYPQRRCRCCVCSPRAVGERDIIPDISDVTEERERGRKWKYTDASFTLHKYSRINQLPSISHEDPNRAALFDILRSDLL